MSSQDKIQRFVQAVESELGDSYEIEIFEYPNRIEVTVKHLPRQTLCRSFASGIPEDDETIAKVAKLLCRDALRAIRAHAAKWN